jgi:hypothetical protein
MTTHPTLHDITQALAAAARDGRHEEARSLAESVFSIYALVEKRRLVADASYKLLASLEEALPLLVLLGDYVGNTAPDGTDRCAVVLRAKQALAVATGKPVPL